MAYRQLYYKLLKFGMIVSSALMIWKGLMVLTNSGSPIIVVLSGDMQPAFYNRGDLLLLTNYSDEPIRVGENVVFKVDGKDIPIIHRVIRVHEKEDGSIKFLTKGDVNVVDDRGLYAKGQLFLENKDIVGRVRAYFPYLGIVSILMNDNPKFTYAILAFFSIKWLIRRR